MRREDPSIIYFGEKKERCQKKKKEIKMTAVCVIYPTNGWIAEAREMVP
jgi:hypothetical protein